MNEPAKQAVTTVTNPRRDKLMQHGVMPNGYHYISVWTEGAESKPVRVLVCDKCGALVGIFTMHDDWHKKMEEK
jgi:hypothetical protein